MKSLASDFKSFILRGNVIDLAVAVIVGAAFNTVVQSLVKNIFTPFIGWIFGKPNFSDLTVSLGGCDAKGACKGTIMYGAFLTDVVNFVIIGFSVFVIVKTFEKLQHLRHRGPIEEEVDPLTIDQELLTEIRDLLRAQAQPQSAEQ